MLAISPQNYRKWLRKAISLPKQNDMLGTAAASAAAHRGFRPARAILEEMVDTMETVIREHYVTGPALSAMKMIVPPRPPRVKP
jgi:hypothetical protein